MVKRPRLRSPGAPALNKRHGLWTGRGAKAGKLRANLRCQKPEEGAAKLAGPIFPAISAATGKIVREAAETEVDAAPDPVGQAVASVSRAASVPSSDWDNL